MLPLRYQSLNDNDRATYTASKIKKNVVNAGDTKQCTSINQIRRELPVGPTELLVSMSIDHQLVLSYP